MRTAPAVGNPSASLERFRLAGALLVAATLAFVTAIIIFADSASPAWLLYLAPITIAALAYDIPGGVITAAVAAAACAVATPDGQLATLWPEMLMGFAVFAGCGAVVGYQAHRQRSHAAALEQASSLDPLTGILKPAHFDARLAQEVRRAERYDHPLGMVLVRVEDLDDFARVFGHYKADLMLKHLTGVIRLAVRSTDPIGRVGPATFALLLPHADATAARCAAERLQEVCGTAAFEGDALEPVTSCTTGVAWASYPAEADSHATLAQLAHERLAAAASAATPAEPVTVDTGEALP